MERLPGSSYAMQQEIGEQGTPHIQGVIAVAPKKRHSSLCLLFPDVYWRPCKSVTKSIWYCTKEDTRAENTTYKIGGTFTYAMGQVHVPAAPFVPQHVAVGDLWPWQREVYDLLQGPIDSRKIYWYWEPTGNRGKTALVRTLMVTAQNKDVIVVAGKASDMKYQIAKYVEADKQSRGPRVVMLSLARTQEGFISWQGMENIKDGVVTSTKYESVSHIIDPPHMIVFANFPPTDADRAAISVDRWVIKQIPDAPPLLLLEQVPLQVPPTPERYVGGDPCDITMPWPAPCGATVN